MWGRNITYLALLLAVGACSQAPARVLPDGISFVSGVNTDGLIAPMWSPDGTTIAASHVVRAMPDVMGILAPEPRADVILINTETWKATSVFTQKWGDLAPQAWSPDGRSFSIAWHSGPEGNGIYRFDVSNTNITYLAEPGTLSPDETRLAVIVGPYVPYIRITDLRTQIVRGFLPPAHGDWYISAWSPDMKYLTLVRLERELGELRFGNVYLLDVNSGDFSQFTYEGNLVASSPTLAPNGQLIAYFASTLVISRLDHGCEWTLPLPDVYAFTWSPDSKKMFLIAHDGAYLADLETLFGSSFSSSQACR